jgi:L-malate glycosyltransferase
MRIAFLADASLPHTLRWVNFFASRGHDGLLLSLERGGGYDCPLVHLTTPGGLPRFLRYTLAVPAAARRLHDFRPDLVNAHFLPNYGWMATRLHASPFVLTTLGSDILLVPKLTPLHRWRTRHVLARCDRVTADAPMLAAAIAAFGVLPERILTVPFGIEPGRFDTLRERPARPLVVLSTRRLEPVYDVATLLRAFELLPAGLRQGMELRIAGTGSELRELRRIGLDPPARFLGWLAPAALDRALSAAHVYVSASRSDSTSVSLLEAMAAGCLPVVSDIPGNREWMRDGENGLLFPAGDAAALAACLQRAAADPELRARAAGVNRELVATRASWPENMARVETLFAELTGRTGS